MLRGWEAVGDWHAHEKSLMPSAHQRSSCCARQWHASRTRLRASLMSNDTPMWRLPYGSIHVCKGMMANLFLGGGMGTVF